MWMDNWVLNIPQQYWPKFGPENHPVLFRFFESKAHVVVLSSSNLAENEVNTQECEKLNIPILKRKGGGGTVLLGPGCLILTLAFYAKDVYGNSKYFKMINDLWIQSLVNTTSIQNIEQRGFSDICIGHKKIAGTSLFRKKHLLVYQGSLLVNPNFELINNVLKHPSREPDYRKGRPHSEFLTSLNEFGFTGSTDDLALKCQTYFNEHFYDLFKNELIII